ncbi:hypothetical protein E3P81_02861 [Wallemia ichthyophaga]|nr:hypothetical protein E3P97_02963 [Wallemia ichthyophaga]TIB00628.1 hypothetical protein E3P96_02604 [Wallemia ichthyophaga]TIB30731.1 hypothetical protein E3P85_02606 [Wallemia ichthyophaga]TIB45371.1 hypothetical protein E3P82_02862 [Wallemia ichthyophaga]TIB48433.1 hypothetical protein E3P81_02861 [Wallemia ichthyophaga]
MSIAAARLPLDLELPSEKIHTTHITEKSQKLQKHDSASTLSLPLHDSVEVQENVETIQVEADTNHMNRLTVDIDATRNVSASPSGTYNENKRSFAPSPASEQNNVEEVGLFQKSYYPNFIHALRDSKSNSSGRTIILCLDGTGDQFDGDNSNVVRFFRCLKKDEPSKQLVYYQAGLGTYTTTRSANPITTRLSAIGDVTIGSGLGHHIRDAYAFLMENYTKGDKICMVGFSRGAYSARGLAGMLQKVGLLPKGNREQVGFAYHMFKDNSDEGWKMSQLFKETFSIKVNIHWIGAWDSVSSIGFIPRDLPFHKSNNAVKNFTHAVALDEHRAKFKAGHWTRSDEMEVRIGPWQRRKEELKPKFGDINEIEEDDVIQEQKDTEEDPKRAVEKKRAKVMKNIKEIRKRTQKSSGEDDTSVDAFNPEIQAQFEMLFELQDKEDLSETKVKEVFFTGCHADVGGGAVANHTRHSLARIPLRFMLRQAFKADTGLLFSTDLLDYYGLDLNTLYPYVTRRPPAAEGPPEGFPELPQQDNPRRVFPEAVEDYYDALCPYHDYLNLSKGWWVLELWPLREIYQDGHGKYRKRLAPNLGHHRAIRGTNNKFHRSVAIRQKQIGYDIKARMVDSPTAHWVG